MTTPDKPLSPIGLPGLHETANALSKKGQLSYLRLTRIRLVLAILAATAGSVTAAAGSQSTIHTAFASAAVVAFLLALASEVLLLTNRPEERWYHGRAVAESTKTLAWRYAMRAEPFAAHEPESAAARRLSDMLQEILAESPIANNLPPPAGPTITDEMRILRASSLEERREAYIERRVDDQAKWYSAKAAASRRNASRWRGSLILFEVIGAIGAVFVLVHVLTVVLDGVLASMIAGAGAWIEVKQFDNLAEAYNLTAIELTFVRSDADQAVDEQSWSTYVDSAEQAVSREHTMWLARRVKPKARKIRR